MFYPLTSIGFYGTIYILSGTGNTYRTLGRSVQIQIQISCSTVLVDRLHAGELLPSKGKCESWRAPAQTTHEYTFLGKGGKPTFSCIRRPIHASRLIVLVHIIQILFLQSYNTINAPSFLLSICSPILLPKVRLYICSSKEYPR